jgi:hypothetical protein
MPNAHPRRRFLVAALALLPVSAPAHHWGNHGSRRPGKVWTRCKTGAFWNILVVEYDRVGKRPDGTFLWRERRRFLASPVLRARQRRCDGFNANAYPPGEILSVATPEPQP